MKNKYKHYRLLSVAIIGMMLMTVCGCHDTSNSGNAETSDIEGLGMKA